MYQKIKLFVGFLLSNIFLFAVAALIYVILKMITGLHITTTITLYDVIITLIIHSMITFAFVNED
jgi:hypothetical protein